MNTITLTIKNLFGDRNLSININPDVTVIIAENGKGKTTILQFIYAIFTGKYYLLLKYEFDSFTIKSGKSTYHIKRKDIFTQHSPQLSKLRRFIGDESINKIFSQISFGDSIRGETVRKMVYDISRKSDIPPSYYLVSNIEHNNNTDRSYHLHENRWPCSQS
jgi:predicted ATP-dependent endonuclease of OLD family